MELIAQVKAGGSVLPKVPQMHSKSEKMWLFSIATHKWRQQCIC